MAEDGVNRSSGARRRRLTESGAKLILLVGATACAGVLLAIPRPVPPLEPPSLVLDRHRTGELVQADRQAAAEAPDDELAGRLQRLYEQQGRAEASETGEPAGTAGRRLGELRRALAALRERHGEAGLWALRARAVERGMALLEPGGDAEAREALLGSLPAMMAKYDLMKDGRRVAPRFVVRTLAKARWNAIGGLELTAGLAPLERKAYWGWLALHASGAPLGRRRQALDHYARAGGERIAEARGALAWQDGRFAEATRYLGEAYARRPSFRLRNHRLAAMTSE